MDSQISDTTKWSESLFGNSALGDKRLTKRLVQISAQLSSNPGDTISKTCGGDEAILEAGYRFLRNARITASDIASSGYESTIQLAKKRKLLLAIEDTTSLSYRHEVSKELGCTGNKKNSKTKGYLVHSTMIMDAEQENTIGLVAQERWIREDDDFGKKHDCTNRDYETKESYKWERNTKYLEEGFGEKIQDVISVCDREADLYEYIQYKIENNQRFIVRASHNRKLTNTNELLFPYVSKSNILGEYEIEIAQKLNRKKRKVTLELRATTVILNPPKKTKNSTRILVPITVNAVIAREKDPQNDTILEWIILTTEDVYNFESTRKITRYYELRWRIEDFHKAWKTGAGAEKQRMQSSDNLEKMVVILSFVAIRMLQLKEFFEKDSLILKTDEVCSSCNKVLSDIEWKVLWKTIEKKDLPTEVPSAAWAFKAIAKLGGWTNSKRNNKASWATIWDGWFRLAERVQGFQLAKSIE